MILVLIIISILSGVTVNELEYHRSCVYMGTQGQGLYYCDPVNMELNKIPDEHLPCKYISAVYCRDQFILVGTYNGIVILDEDFNLIDKYIPGDYYHRWITDIAYFKGSYIFSNLYGLIKYARGRFTFIPTAFATSVLLGEDTLWLGTDRGLWFSTDLAVFHHSAFYTECNSAQYLPVTDLVRDSGWFWIGMEDDYSDYSPGGLWLFDSEWESFRMGRNSGLVFNGISALYPLDDLLLLGTYCKINGLRKGGGLQILSAQGIVSWLGLSRIFPLINDFEYIPSLGQLWIATDQGVEIVQAGQLVEGQ
ncbi:MAG: hypothetical protein APR63_06960 [Desulfuromonas sp. SDB]|nr:MAG: hypothetical protein APR63_06960 [Desulfuromonas sp. SDB]